MKVSQTSTSILAVAFSFLASSHHWLHMTILLMLGGTTDMMASMSAFVWVRRFMIIATLITMVFSVYRLVKKRCRNNWVIGFTILTAIVSLGFVAHTLRSSGW